MRKILLLIIILLVIVGAVFISKGRQLAVPSQESTFVAPSVGSETIAGDKTIRMTAGGFEPAVLTIKKGETVTWVNEDSRDRWPASALHPTHTVYPQRGGCISSAFDACMGLKTGASWSFTFDQVGGWGYHDHLNAIYVGRIEVVE